MHPVERRETHEDRGHLTTATLIALDRIRGHRRRTTAVLATATLATCPDGNEYPGGVLDGLSMTGRALDEELDIRGHTSSRPSSSRWPRVRG